SSLSRILAETTATISTTPRFATHPTPGHGGGAGHCPGCSSRARFFAASINNRPSASSTRSPSWANPGSEPMRAPEFMRLLVVPEQPRIEGAAMDFRDEIMAQIFDKGDPKPKRTLTFNIEVTDEGSTRGLPAFERRTFKNWRRIGRIVFDNAVASYNGDFVIHFSHPTWRNDRNDPASVVRMNGRKVG